MTATLTWTKQRPTVPGLYLWRHKASQAKGTLWVEAGTDTAWLPGIEWAGPIAEPREATG